MSNALTAGRPSARKNPAATLASLTDEGATKRVNFELAVDLHQRLKIHATRQGKTIREVLTEFVTNLPE